MMKIRNEMMEHKIIILLPYCDRPKMVRNALRSLIMADKYYKNWVLHFYDDASMIPGEPIVREVLADLLDKVHFHRLEMTPEDKLASGGIMGRFFNEIIEKTDADLGIMLCDDDALHPTYLYNLNQWFKKHPDCKNCWSHIIHYAPRREAFEDMLRQTGRTEQVSMGDMDEGILAANRCDASQVAWRISCNKQDGAWFPPVCDKCHDYHFYNELYQKSGPCHHTNFLSQFKGLHDGQLCHHAWSHVATKHRHVCIDIPT